MKFSSAISSVSLSLLHLASVAKAAWPVPQQYAIRPSADGHFFQLEDGSPFFWQADTAWLLFHRLNYTEAQIYLDDRSRKGFTVVLAVGFTQIGITSPNRAGDLPFIDEDPTKPNEPYWAYIDSIVELAWSYGIRIALIPCWGQYIHDSEGNPSVINGTTAVPFGSFIGSRYPYLPKILVADTNPLWENKTAVIADFSAGGVIPKYQHQDWRPIYDDLANGIVAGERKATGNSNWEPIMTIHPTNLWFSGLPIALASEQVGDRDWLTMNACQSGHTDFPPDGPIPWWNARRAWEPVSLMYQVGISISGKKRPALDNEAHYEARYDDGKPAYFYWNASDVRTGTWQTVLSGAAGLTYGADNVMQMYIPGIYTQDGTGPARTWYADIDLPGAGQMQYVQKAIFDRGNSSYFTRIPAQDIIISNAGTDDFRITAARDMEGSWIMVYTPTSEEFTIDTSDLKVKNIKASWYDPTAGTYDVLLKIPPAVGTETTFNPPAATGHLDWVLVLEEEG